MHLAFGAMLSIIDNRKIRIFLLDVMYDVERYGGTREHPPLRQGRLYRAREIMSAENTIHELVPTFMPRRR